MESITLKCLLAGSKARLGVTGEAGFTGLAKEINWVQGFSGRIEECFRWSLAPATLLIIAPSTGVALAGVSWRRRNDFFAALPAARVTSLALAGINDLPDWLLPFAEQTSTFVFSSRFDDHLLTSRLVELLCERLSRRILVHGALVNICGAGVLITGDSGVGKTTLALAMARRGHKWIADDAVEIEKRNDGVLHGRSQALVKNLLEIKGIGVSPVQNLLAADCIDEATAVHMVAEIGPCSAAKPYGWNSYRKIMKVRLPLFQIPPSGGHDRDEELENAARTISQRE